MMEDRKRCSMKEKKIIIQQGLFLWWLLITYLVYYNGAVVALFHGMNAIAVRLQPGQV